jgi:hypothetical protein
MQVICHLIVDRQNGSQIGVLFRGAHEFRRNGAEDHSKKVHEHDAGEVEQIEFQGAHALFDISAQHIEKVEKKQESPILKKNPRSPTAATTTHIPAMILEVVIELIILKITIAKGDNKKTDAKVTTTFSTVVISFLNRPSSIILPLLSI